jgi:predicted RNase H-like HicB family nuclease
VASYRVSLVRTGEGSAATWQAEVDELPDVSARGASPEEAVRRVWAAANEATGEDGTPRHSGKLLVRMPATLHDELAAAAEREGVSLNQLITGVLAASVEWRVGGADDSLPSRLTRFALAANLTAVLIAAIVAITVLMVAWRG